MPLFDSLRRKFRNDSNETQFDPFQPTRSRSFSTMSVNIEKTLGWKIRDAVGSLEKNLGPHLKKIFPNFIAVHYFYIFTATIIGSILMYPVKNLRYIDVLFFAACSSTQAGLNTIDINSITLYQQIVIYIICMFTTPIFIHGSLCFLRLYWFERYFDNIRESSKLNFKMRRTATMAARTQSIERQKTFETQRQNLKRKNSAYGQSTTNNARLSTVPNTGIKQNSSSNEQNHYDNSELKLEEETTSSSEFNHINTHIPSPTPSPRSNDQVQHFSEPSSTEEEREDDEEEEEEEEEEEVEEEEEEDDDGDHDKENHEHPKTPYNKSHLQEDVSGTPNSNIKFADLPKPRRQEVEPRDVYMSISMLRNNQPTKNITEEDEGPALVIRGPAEREHVRQNSIQFDLKDKPKHRRKRSGLRRSFLFNKHTSTENGDNGNHHYHQKHRSNDDSNINEQDEGDNALSKTQSHLALPSSDQTGGTKFNKRSNTLDVPTNKDTLLKKSPTFEKLIRQKLNPARGFRRRFSSSALIDDDEYDRSDSDTDNDDEYSIGDNSLRRQMSGKYLSWNPTVGRNSTFFNLSDDQKEELGGVEYRAIKLLAKLLVAYYVGFHILAFVMFVPWIIRSKTYQQGVSDSGVTLTWWGFFTGMSSFNDLGYTLTPNSMNNFNTSPYALLVSAFFIVIGNTGFPILLRFIIWVLFQGSVDLSLFKESLGFLLDHPRRCFTLLFPSAPTWWLFFILVVLNAVDLILFIILDIGADVLKGLSTGNKVLDGFYQAVSTRTAGFACLDLSKLHPSVQVSYMVMMYISVLPLAISIRRTNVYEEQSLGVYLGDSNNNNNNNNNQNNENDHDAIKPTSFIGAHLRKQLSFDLWFVFLGLFIICICEGDRIKDTTLPDFNVFQIMFEVVSAYGTVGLSLGYPNTNASFCGKFTVLSKLVIIAMMIRGRHRGLPYSLDRAIMLPSEKMEIRDKYQNLHTGNHLNRAETVASANDDPVLEFFKSAAPKVIRDRLKRPSFFSARSQSISNSNNPGISRAHTRERAIDEEMDEDQIGSNALNQNSSSFKNFTDQDNDGVDFGPTHMSPSSHHQHDHIIAGSRQEEGIELNYFNERNPHSNHGSTASL